MLDRKYFLRCATLQSLFADPRVATLLAFVFVTYGWSTAGFLKSKNQLMSSCYADTEDSFSGEMFAFTGLLASVVFGGGDS